MSTKNLPLKLIILRNPTLNIYKSNELCKLMYTIIFKYGNKQKELQI